MVQNCWIYLKMKSTVLIASVLLLILTKHVKVLALQVDTMDSRNTPINLLSPSFGSLSSGILKSHSGFSYTVNRNKTLIVTAPVGYSIMVAIRYIDLRPHNQDLLTLSSTYGVPNPKKYSNSYSFNNKQYYPNEEETYYVSSGKLAVTFTTGPSFLSAGYDGFELVYTVQGKWSLCNAGDYYCDNGRCISSMLTCDGHNHCGDRSSERNCYIPRPGSGPGSGPGRTIGIVSGSFFVLIAILCGLYLVCRRRFAVQRQTIVTSHPPPPTNMPSYPPSYPYSSSQYPPPPPAYSTGITNPTYH